MSARRELRDAAACVTGGFPLRTVGGAEGDRGQAAASRRCHAATGADIDSPPWWHVACRAPAGQRAHEAVLGGADEGEAQDRLMAPVSVRPYRISDAATLFAAAIESVGEVFPFLPWCHPNLIQEDCLGWIAAQVAAFEAGTAYEFVIGRRGRTLPRRGWPKPHRRRKPSGQLRVLGQRHRTSKRELDETRAVVGRLAALSCRPIVGSRPPVKSALQTASMAIAFNDVKGIAESDRSSS